MEPLIGGVVVIAGTSWFVLALAILHSVRADVNPYTRGVSRYAVGAYGWVISTAFAGLAGAFASAALVFAGPGDSSLVTTSLWIAATGLALAILFPLRSENPRQAEYLTHQFGGATFFCAATIAGFSIAKSRLIQPLSTNRIMFVSGWVGSVALVLFVASIAFRGSPLAPVRGLLQRLCFFSITVSLFMVGCSDVAGALR